MSGTRLFRLDLPHMDQTTLANMRSRVGMARRLAESTTDPRTAKILRQMADVGEADIRRLETEVHATATAHELKNVNTSTPTVS